MNICLIASEFLGYGIAGGFGFATRSLGRSLVQRGHLVTVVIPQPVGQMDPVQEIDGLCIRTFPRKRLLHTGALYREIQADMYHSQEPSLSTYLAMRAVPEARHVVTLRDPRDIRDWWIEFMLPSRTRHRLLLTAAFYENPWTRKAIRRADKVWVPAKFLVEKAQRHFRLSSPPEFIPTPVSMPQQTCIKNERPTICWVGRIARRKRPEHFLALAGQFPDIEFIMVGDAQERAYSDRLLRMGRCLKNLKILPFFDPFLSSDLSEIYADSWMLINTAAREGLPNTFIEAASHGCAIISPNNPDGFAGQFGMHCPAENYAKGIETLLHNDLWRTQGEKGRAYVEKTNESERATAIQIAAYEAVL